MYKYCPEKLVLLFSRKSERYYIILRVEGNDKEKITYVFSCIKKSVPRPKLVYYKPRIRQ
jgi:hypothetical protein